jgi:Cof subfamily protein (haloacid dehalogenase superfamily)
MKYRLIAIDLDDTFLNADSAISSRNKQAVREAVKRGVMVTVATGRMYRTSIPYVRELELNMDWPMINYQGALIKTTESKEVLYQQPIENDLAASLAGYAEAKGYHVNAFIDDCLYIEEENEFSRYYQSIADIELEAVGKLAPFLKQQGEDPFKLTIINWDGRIKQIEKSIKAEYGEKIVVLQSLAYFLEITDKRATKGQALHWLSQYYGIEREEIIAFGDSYNDLDMIEYAGLGVAVANARPEVRRAADLITAANTEDGVAQVIEEYILSCV